MNIIHHYQQEQDIESIAALTCACLAAIRQSQAGKPVYLGALIRSLAAAPVRELAG